MGKRNTFGLSCVPPSLLILGICLSIMLSIATASAQIAGAHILGTVTDTNGAVIGEAVVFLECKKGNFQKRISTVDDGSFRIVGVPNGSCNLKIGATGFKTYEKDLTIRLGKNEVLARLEPGGVTFDDPHLMEALPVRISTDVTTEIRGTITVRPNNR